MSGRHFLADRDELSGWLFFKTHLQGKGVGGGAGGRTESLDRPGTQARSWARASVLTSQAPCRLLVCLQGYSTPHPKSARSAGWRGH